MFVLLGAHSFALPLQESGGSHGVDAETLHQAALDALSIDDFDSARVYLRQAVQLAPQARTCTLLPEREVVLACHKASRAEALLPVSRLFWQLQPLLPHSPVVLQAATVVSKRTLDIRELPWTRGSTPCGWAPVALPEVAMELYINRIIALSRTWSCWMLWALCWRRQGRPRRLSRCCSALSRCRQTPALKSTCASPPCALSWRVFMMQLHVRCFHQHSRQVPAF